MTIFCLRSNLYRDTAPVPFINFIYRENNSSIYQTYTAIAPALNKICTRTAKSTPYLSCHRDNFPAKAPGPVAGWLRQITQPPFIAGPLGVIALIICTPNNVMNTSLFTDRFVTFECSLHQLAEKGIWNAYRLAPKSTSPHTQPFASLPFCPLDRSCMAQLTSNTDGIIHKLVMVFAFYSCT